MDLGSWQTQLRKGAAELVVLALLGRKERYGLEILEGAGEAGELVTEGALYPLLTRLEREGKLASRWALDEGASHPRKYYRLTGEGERLLAEMRPVWSRFHAQVTTIVEREQ
ncbi:PadR family transcriptional regulator [Caulobacter sp. 17J65-9]|uniref:PadR family transcriptional regulator n=1 Tax=Caulobacter sp. 17J65-9 TaxID=2709382 RepID=UPI0013C7F113|nr:PadR family transcriptional regulator [Caulobacter sp. 17J65-9]NEX93877.1 helix-turn-helix transcriptional regulator [Caulobacter sp. 17J65-9]